jgi:nucleotide-binding universal stress UspA family protein
MESYRRILCPTDFSDFAKRAVHHAAALAKEMSAELTLFHAFQNPAYVLPMSGYAGPTADAVTRLRQQLTTELEAAADDVRKLGITVHTRLDEGVPHSCILEHARAWKADLIVMGTHGRAGLAHALIGSVAERVVRSAPCSVLVTRARD